MRIPDKIIIEVFGFIFIVCTLIILFCFISASNKVFKFRDELDGLEFRALSIEDAIGKMNKRINMIQMEPQYFQGEENGNKAN